MDPGRQPAAQPRVGRYDVLLRIASGGMATVYLARASGAAGFAREVALKVTHPHLADDPELSRQLLEEAKLAVAIRHANVVSILDVGEENGSLFLVMEYVEGDTLAGLLRASRGLLPPRIFLRILLDALAGLHAAHELIDAEGRPLGLVHRDFSPQNILIGTDGIARLTDFGIAKASARQATNTGIVKGKVNYMSPEQALGRDVDRRTDVWAAGVVAWEAFAGRRLHLGDEIAAIADIVKAPPPPLRSIKPEVHPAIELAVTRALVLDREARTPTAAAFAKELAAALREAGIDLADSSDVALAVQELAGKKLSERRRKARGQPEAPVAAAPEVAAPAAPPQKPAKRSRASRRSPPVRSVHAAATFLRARSVRIRRPSPEELAAHEQMLAAQLAEPPTAPAVEQSVREIRESPTPAARRSLSVVLFAAIGFALATMLVAAVTRTVARGHPGTTAAGPPSTATFAPSAEPVALSASAASSAHPTPQAPR